MEEATIGLKLPMKIGLRKSFATLAIGLGVEGRLVEAYLGHSYSNVSAVTTRHYKAQERIQELRSVSGAINHVLAQMLAHK